MQINIPDNAVSLLQERAGQAGFASVDDYVLSIVLPTVFQEDASRKDGPQEDAPQEKPANERSFYDAAKSAGLIGKYDDYPPDLSTNPKYMEGFGE